MYINKERYDVICVGEVTLDAFMTLLRPDEVFRYNQENRDLTLKHGSKIDVEKYVFSVGGNATNVSVALSRLELRAGLCTEMGDDELSLIIRNTLAKERVERLLIKQKQNTPSSFSVILSYQEERTIFVEDVEREHDFDFADVTAPVVYLTSLGNEWKKPYQKTLEFVREHKSMLVFNPGSRQLRDGKDIVDEVIKETAMLFVNKEEAEQIVFGKETENHAEDHVKELLRALAQKGAKTVIVTDGTRGSYALSPEGEFYYQAAGDSKIVDRTGAGDSYTAGFLAATIYGKSLQEAMKWGTENASSVVTIVGAHNGLLTKEVLEKKATISS